MSPVKNITIQQCFWRVCMHKTTEKYLCCGHSKRHVHHLPHPGIQCLQTDAVLIGLFSVSNSIY